MEESSTERFLRMMHEQNVAIAENEAKKEVKKTHQPDPIRVQREEERRKKMGPLRARGRPGNRPSQGWGEVPDRE